MSTLIRNIILSCLMVSVSGCAILGFVAQAAPPPLVKPKYTDLAGQSVGVMVWADRGIQIDWPNLQLDMASAVQRKLMDEQKKAKTLKDTTFPVQPASIVRYQRDHPETESMTITQVAPKLGVSRLIYVEIEEFATRSDMSVELYRGTARGTVRVIEIDESGRASIAFELNDVEAVFPIKGPREGNPGFGDARTYSGIVDQHSTEIARLFFPWRPEEHLR
jgi:hypothetical protein